MPTPGMARAAFSMAVTLGALSSHWPEVDVARRLPVSLWSGCAGEAVFGLAAGLLVSFLGEALPLARNSLVCRLVMAMLRWLIPRPKPIRT